ncbi:mandelate racemase/muconate lactonizing enzyme family protein [Ruania suaedae]|uniref:mandelate racemase/muconate lactonizing enzyme family protein n=1 Tax=Ruania suaedae TaxID=2897774 RepID=UPI001E35F3FB|nr:mandelate racemase/muconate lactonizing enzyme family protein [Ruania suaedae]UFU02786.1 mandelate racemase/muconate lactonizing enzyme family protein [Ruania suaedae]
MSTIADLRLTPLNISRTTGFVCGHVIVEIDTDDGLLGVGEMSDLQHLPRFHPDIDDLTSTLRAMLLGADIWDANQLTGLLAEAFPPAGALYDKGAVIRCGVDLALWDLRGKATGRSVTSLLGGAVRPSLPVAYPIFRQRSEADVEANLELVAARLDAGFSMFRVYVGGDLGLDEEFLRRLRERFEQAIQIKSLDFSNLLDAPAATRFIERTRDVDYALVEAPAHEGDVTGLAEVRRRTLIPVSEHVYDARSALRLVAERAVDVFNVGLFALGGITPAQQVIAIADAARLDTLIGTTQELSIGTAAAAHLGVATVSARVAADPVGPLLYDGDVVTEPVTYRQGHLAPPPGPGLGMSLDARQLQQAAGPLRWEAGSGSVIDRVGAQT